jgi:hypothetical protein
MQSTNAAVEAGEFAEIPRQEEIRGVRVSCRMQAFDFLF